MVTHATIDREKEVIMQDLARKAACDILRRGSTWDPKCKSDGIRRVKYQAGLTHEEAAEIEALRKHLCPYYSRYAFVRLLIMEFCQVARNRISNYERTCCSDD